MAQVVMTVLLFSAKTVNREEVNDDPDESVNSDTADPERPQKDARTVREEQLPSSSAQHLHLAVLEQEQEQEQSQDKRRRNQGKANKREATTVLESVLDHSSPPAAEIHKSKFQAHPGNVLLEKT